MGIKISALTASPGAPQLTDIFEVSRYNGISFDSRKNTFAQILSGISANLGIISSFTTTGNFGASTYSAGTLNIPVYTLAGLGGISSVLGTAGRISVSGGNIVNIDTAYVGQSSITTLGTITTGTWQGSQIAGAYLVNSGVTGQALTGLSITGSTISSTDTILQAFGKLQNQMNSVGGGGTTNYIPLWTSANTQGISMMYQDTVNNRLGIGTTTLPAGTFLTIRDIHTSASGDDSIVRVLDSTGTVVCNLINKAGNGAYMGIGNLSGVPTANYHAQGFDNTSATFTFKAHDSSAFLYWSLRNDKRMVYVDGNEAAGKFLGCDANGVATWQTLASSGITGTGTNNTIMKWNGTTAAQNSSSTDDGTTTTIGGILKLSSYISNSTVVAAQITGNVTNYSLTPASYYLVYGSAIWTIEGIVAPTSSVMGTEITFVNTGTFNILFAINSGTTTAANRIYSPSPIILTPGNSITLVYDLGFSGGQRWRIKNPALGVTVNVNSLIFSSRLISDVTKSANTTFINLSELTATTVVGKKYKVELELFCTTTTTGGAKVDFTGTATNFVGFGHVFETTPTLLSVMRITTLGDVTGANSTSGAGVHIKVVATFVANSTTLIPRFAQNSAAGGTTALAQSTMVLTEII